MKRIILVLVLLACFAYAYADGIAWDPHPEQGLIDGIRVYKLSALDGTGPRELLATLPADATEASLALAIGDTVALTAFSREGGESVLSEPLTIAERPEAPTGLRVKVTVTVDVETPEP